MNTQVHHNVLLPVLAIALGASPGLATDHAGTISSDQTWFAADNPHVVINNVTVVEGVTLTIEAGAEVRFVGGRNLAIRGTLAAAGAPGAQITFTRDATSAWGGIYFNNSGGGTLSYCTIERATYGIYGASSGTVAISHSILRYNLRGISASSGVYQLAGTTLSDNDYFGFQGSGVAFTLMDANCLVENSDTGISLYDADNLNLTGLTVRGCSVAGIDLDRCDNAVLDDLTLTGNTGTHGAIYVEDCGEFTLGGGNSIGGAGLENSWPVSITAGSYLSAASVVPTSGNTNNGIRVASSTSTRSGVWRHFDGVDYFVRGTTGFNAGAALTIEDGVHVRIASNIQLVISGTVTASGTAGAGILFTRDSAANWGQIGFQAAGGGTFEYCTFEFASVAINTSSSGTINIRDSILRSNSQAVHVNSGTVAFLRDQIINNSTYGVNVAGGTPVFGSSESEWNDIHGNGAGVPGRDLHNYLTDITAQYIYWGTTDWTVIEDMIWSNHDDPAVGHVAYVPICTAGHANVITAAPDAALPARSSLAQNFPNPFNPSTTIAFDLPRSGVVRLAIHDVAGKVVATPIAGPLAAGHHQITWTGCDDHGRALPSGVYVYRLNADAYNEARRMLLVR